ncbi:hypothetical protein V1511DRAFT_338196 [Dipodascopsis uninucleata]
MKGRPLNKLNIFSRKLSTASTLIGSKCLITGGSRGIGRAIADKLAKDGVSIIIISRTLKNAENAISTLDSTKGQQHHAVELDVSGIRRPWTSEDLGGLLNFQALKSVDMVVNAAGITHTKLLCFMSPDEIDCIINTNLMGTIYSCRTFARSMMKNPNGGSILNFSSVLSTRGGRGSSIYAAAKSGIEGLTLSLASELGSKNVRVNALRCGLIDTQMTDSSLNLDSRRDFLSRVPLGRIGTTDEVADAALFLLKNTYANGTIMSLDGGFNSSL